MPSNRADESHMHGAVAEARNLEFPTSGGQFTHAHGRAGGEETIALHELQRQHLLVEGEIQRRLRHLPPQPHAATRATSGLAHAAAPPGPAPEDVSLRERLWQRLRAEEELKQRLGTSPTPHAPPLRAPSGVAETAAQRSNLPEEMVLRAIAQQRRLQEEEALRRLLGNQPPPPHAIALMTAGRDNAAAPPQERLGADEAMQRLLRNQPQPQEGTRMASGPTNAAAMPSGPSEEAALRAIAQERMQADEIMRLLRHPPPPYAAAPMTSGPPVHAAAPPSGPSGEAALRAGAQERLPPEEVMQRLLRNQPPPHAAAPLTSGPADAAAAPTGQPEEAALRATIAQERLQAEETLQRLFRGPPPPPVAAPLTSGPATAAAPPSAPPEEAALRRARLEEMQAAVLRGRPPPAFYGPRAGAPGLAMVGREEAAAAALEQERRRHLLRLLHAPSDEDVRRCAVEAGSARGAAAPGEGVERRLSMPLAPQPLTEAGLFGSCLPQVQGPLGNKMMAPGLSVLPSMGFNGGPLLVQENSINSLGVSQRGPRCD